MKSPEPAVYRLRHFFVFRSASLTNFTAKYQQFSQQLASKYSRPHLLFTWESGKIARNQSNINRVTSNGWSDPSGGFRITCPAGVSSFLERVGELMRCASGRHEWLDPVSAERFCSGKWFRALRLPGDNDDLDADRRVYDGVGFVHR
jgi:hypothetical protein